MKHVKAPRTDLEKGAASKSVGFFKAQRLGMVGFSSDGRFKGETLAASTLECPHFTGVCSLGVAIVNQLLSDADRCFSTSQILRSIPLSLKQH